MLRRETLLFCSAMLGTVLGQAPTQQGARAPAPQLKHDTIYVAVQSPPANVVVEAQSQLPAVILGVLGLFLVSFQIWIMRRQTTIMANQTEILDRQTALAAQQAEWQVGEAVGTFVRLAHDLVTEFRKADVRPMEPIDADFETHPRQMLREASRLFAPLGPAFLMAANQAAMRLDDYFSAVATYTDVQTTGAGSQQLLDTVQSLRRQIGGDLDLANRAIPEAHRWRYQNGKDYDFRSLCSLPEAFSDKSSEGARRGPDHTDVFQP